MILVLLALVVPTLLGFVIVAALLRQEERTGLLERVCLSYPLGVALLTLQMFFLGLARAPLTPVFIMLPVLIEILGLSFWIMKRNIVLVPKPSFGLVEEIASAQTSGAKKAALIVLAAWAVIKFVSIFVETGLRPIWAWDAWSDWSVGAKLFSHAKSLLLDAPAQDYFGRGAVSRITAYPLLNTLMQTWISLWTGGFDEVLAKFWSPVFLLCLGGYLYSFAVKELDRLSALALLVLFLSSPLMSYHAVEVYSDLPLAVYLLLTAASFLQVMRGKRAYWPFIGLFSAAALFTKDESLFFIAPLVLSAIVFLWKNSDEPRAKKNAAISLLAPFLLVAPWYLFKTFQRLGLGAEMVGLAFTFHPEVVLPAVQQMLSLENFNVFLLFFPVFLIVAGKPSREVLHLLFALACYALFFLMLYAFTTIYFEHFNRRTVFSRNVLTYYPVVTLLTMMFLKKMRQQPKQAPAGKRRR